MLVDTFPPAKREGQQDDWFGSRFITTFTVLSVIALTAAVIWELHQKDPVVDLSLLTRARPARPVSPKCSRTAPDSR
jgi:hypothetical protein